MFELKEPIYSTVTTDATIISLMGITSGDLRMYSLNPPEDVIYSDAVPAAITYFLKIGRRPNNYSYPSQEGNAFLFFRILSIDNLIAENIADRLKVLFDKMTIESDNYVVKTVMLNDMTPSDSEGSPTKPVFIINVSFRLTNVLAK